MYIPIQPGFLKMAAQIFRKCLVLTGYGGYDKLQVQHLPLSEMNVMGDAGLPPGYVLVRIKCAGVNFSELMNRQGLYRTPYMPHAPCILGFEGSGVVEQVSKGVEDLKVCGHNLHIRIPNDWHMFINSATCSHSVFYSMTGYSGL